MTEAGWKLVVDRHGVTIASDRFRLTTNGSQQAEFALDDDTFQATESTNMEAIVSELQSMTWRSYGQFCGLAHALEVVGERWALLIVRDLLLGPRSVEELQHSFPRMPDAILLTRLKELEYAGVVRRRSMPADTAVSYELTEYGAQLDAVVVALAGWGAQTLGEPRSEDLVSTDSLIMLLRSTFQPEAVPGAAVSFVLRYGPAVVHARVDGSTLSTGDGELPDADLVIEAEAVIRALMAGDVSPAEAIEGGAVRLTGDPALLDRFVRLFAIPRPPTRSA